MRTNPRRVQATLQALISALSLLTTAPQMAFAQTAVAAAPVATAAPLVDHGYWTLAGFNCAHQGNHAGSAFPYFARETADQRPSFVHFFGSLLVEEFGQGQGCVISRQSRILNSTASAITIEPQVLKMSDSCRFILPGRPSLMRFESGLRLERTIETRSESNGSPTGMNITSNHRWDFEQLGCRTPTSTDNENTARTTPARPEFEVDFLLVPATRINRNSAAVRILARDRDFINEASVGNLANVQALVQASMISTTAAPPAISFALPSINTEARDLDGRTALMLAARNGHSEVVSYLLSIKASARAMDPDGNTALSLARAASHSEIVALLEPKITTFQVIAANPQWQDSVTIASNETVSIEVTGSWGIIDPASRGNRGYAGYEIDAGPSFMTPGLREGELLAQVFGTGQNIRLGGPDHVQPVIAGPGILQFMANDGAGASTFMLHDGAGYRDNTGALSVRITKELM